MQIYCDVNWAYFKAKFLYYIILYSYFSNNVTVDGVHYELFFRTIATPSKRIYRFGWYWIWKRSICVPTGDFDFALRDSHLLAAPESHYAVSSVRRRRRLLQLMSGSAAGRRVFCHSATPDELRAAGKTRESLQGDVDVDGNGRRRSFVGK